MHAFITCKSLGVVHPVYGLLQITDYMLQYEKGRDFVFNKAKKTVMKMTNGKYPAPLKIIEVRVEGWGYAAL